MHINLYAYKKTGDSAVREAGRGSEFECKREEHRVYDISEELSPQKAGNKERLRVCARAHVIESGCLKSLQLFCE